VDWSTIGLLVLAWQIIKSSKGSDNLQSFLSDDAKNIFDCVGKISNKDCSQSDKTGALLNLVTNPTVMGVVDKIFAKTTEQSDSQNTGQNGNQQSTQQQQNCTTKPFQNAEGYTFNTPSEQSTQFFAPINGIADNEVKHKLYSAFDNWYIK